MFSHRDLYCPVKAPSTESTISISGVNIGEFLPERRLEFEELLCSLSGFGDVAGEHADSEELAHVPVVVHLLQGTFAAEQAVQPHA